MAVFLTAIGLFTISFAVHVLVWRWRLPRHHTRSLIAIFTVSPLAAAITFGIVHGSSGWPLVHLGDLPGIGLFYCGAMGCYMILYTAVEEDSPSLLIMNALQTASSRGCSRGELALLVTEDRLVRPRLDALKRDGLVEAQSDGNRLTPRGRQVASLSTMLARIFHLDEGA